MTKIQDCIKYLYGGQNHRDATRSQVWVEELVNDKCKVTVASPYVYCSLNMEQRKELAEYYQTLIDISMREYGDAILHIIDQWGKKQYSIKFPDKLVQGDIRMDPKPDIVLVNPFEKLMANSDCKQS